VGGLPQVPRNSREWWGSKSNPPSLFILNPAVTPRHGDAVAADMNDP
jgi:hypothetical protein